MILDARAWLHASPFRRNVVRGAVLASVLSLTVPFPAAADEDADRETKALDSTATQWSFQGAYQTMPDYHDDEVNGMPRAPGLDNYWQLRVVAPIPTEKVTFLPRLTIRHYENLQNKQDGFGNTELFALIIPKAWDWGSGRTGIGPLVTLPGDEKVARDEWGYGFAAAAVNAAGKWFYGLLLTQSWRSIDPNTLPAGTSDTNPLGIAPFLNYRLSKGWYVGNGDMVAQWDWDSSSFYLPIGVRVGKVLIQEKSSWNLYVEYQTSLIYKDWPGSAVKSSWRFNASYTLPVGL
jgi:hypothetical protein